MFAIAVAGWACEEEDFFLSVSWRKAEGKWRATIQVDRKNEHLGLFEPTPAGEVGAAGDFHEFAIEEFLEHAIAGNATDGLKG